MTEKGFDFVQKQELATSFKQLRALYDKTDITAAELVNRTPLHDAHKGTTSFIAILGILPGANKPNDETVEKIKQTISSAQIRSVVRAELAKDDKDNLIEIEADFEKMDKDIFTFKLEKYTEPQNFGMAMYFSTSGEFKGGTFWTFVPEEEGGLRHRETDVKFDEFSTITKVDQDSNSLFKLGEKINLSKLLGMATDTSEVKKPINLVALQ